MKDFKSKAIVNGESLLLQSFSFALVIFLYSGALKQFLGLYSLPLLDFTLLSLLYLIVIYLFQKKIIDYNNKSIIILFAALSIWVLFGTIYSPSQYFKVVKFFGFFSGVIVCIMVLSIKTLNTASFFRSYRIVTVLLTIIFLYSLPKIFMNDSGLEEGYRSIYLSIPYYLGVAILFLSYEYKNLKAINTKKFIMLNILFFIALLASGARGPLLALLISLLILYYRSFFFHVFLLASGSFFILLFYSFSNSTYTPDDAYLFLIQRFFNRFNKLFEGGVADNPRNELYAYTLNKLDTFSLEQFIGRGTGSFGTLYHHRDMDMHPHNLFLEVWFENGLIGMLILLIIFISFSLRFISYGKFSVSIFVFLFVNAMKSYSLIGSRMMFVILCIISVLYFRRKNES